MAARPDLMKRGRGVAVLLALFYGILTGGAFAPVSAQAHPFAASIVQDGQSRLAITAKSGAATLKAQRATPDPILLPESPAYVRQSEFRVVERPHGLPSIRRIGMVAAAYHARAPPAF